MTEIETVIGSELDRRHPRPDRLPDWDGVLQRAGVSARRRARRRAVLALVGAALAAAAVSLVLVAPWSGGPSFVQQALAAVGSGRYLHFVFRPASSPARAVVDLASGRTRLLAMRVEWVYDTKTGAYDAVAIFEGGAVDDAAPSTPDPAVSRFASGYRSALANGEARVIGETSVGGRKAKILRFPVRFNGAVVYYEDVLVAVDSHRPLLFRYRAPASKARTDTTRVLSIDSSNTRPTLATPHAFPVPWPIGIVVDVRRLDPREAQAALGHAALWPGRSIAGATLQAVRLQAVTTDPPGTSVRGLRLDYRAGTGSLVIEEAATPQYSYGFVDATWGFGPLPRAGEASLVHFESRWQAQLKKSGLFVRIRSQDRSLVIAAARALTPIPH